MAKSFGCEGGVPLRQRQEQAQRLLQGIREAERYADLGEIQRRFVDELAEAFHDRSAPVVGSRTIYWLTDIRKRAPEIRLQMAAGAAAPEVSRAG